jgi:hypothetical protein
MFAASIVDQDSSARALGPNGGSSVKYYGGNRRRATPPGIGSMRRQACRERNAGLDPRAVEFSAVRPRVPSFDFRFFLQKQRPISDTSPRWIFDMLRRIGGTPAKELIINSFTNSKLIRLANLARFPVRRAPSPGSR